MSKQYILTCPRCEEDIDFCQCPPCAKCGITPDEYGGCFCDLEDE